MTHCYTTSWDLTRVVWPWSLEAAANIAHSSKAPELRGQRCQLVAGIKGTPSLTLPLRSRITARTLAFKLSKRTTTMSRLPRSIGAAALALSIFASPVLGHYPGAWYSNSELWNIQTGYTTFTSGDTIRVWNKDILWDSTRASNMRHLASHGYRFTLNVVDLNDNHSSANMYWPNLPNPYFDRDMDGYFKCNEAEVTSESAGFPTAGTKYFGSFYFTRWYYVSSFGGWQWNTGSGRFEHGEQLSEQYGWGDKWDTTNDFSGSVAIIGLSSYGTKARPSVNPGLSAEACQFDGGSHPLSAPAELDPQAIQATGLTLERGDENGEVVLRRDRSVSLNKHRRAAHRAATGVVSQGPAIATVTFARPLGQSELEALELGWSIRDIEAVSDTLQDGTRATYRSAYAPSVWHDMATLAAEESAQMLGVISADVLIPSSKSLSAALAHPDVYLVDVTAEQVWRASDRVQDVVTNDVYWELAGWE